MKTTKVTPERKRGERGKGRLYLRNSKGKEFKAGTQGVDGSYWLEYLRPIGTTDADGKPIKKKTRTKLLDRDGNPVKTLPEAKAAQGRIVAQYITASKKERLHLLKAELEEAEIGHKQAIDEANPPLLISEAWQSYVDSAERPDTGEDTLKHYKGYWDRFNNWLSNNDQQLKYLRDITQKTAKDYANLLTREKLSPNTYNKHIGFLKLLWRVLAEPARIEEDPFDRIQKKKLKTNVRRELSKEELRLVLDNADGELKTLLFLGTFTGLRLGDCATLKWGEVQLEQGLIKHKTAKKEKPIISGISLPLHGILSETPPRKRKGYVLPLFAELYTYRNTAGRLTKQPEIAKIVQSHFLDQGIQTHKEGTGIKLSPDPHNEGQYIRTHTGVRAVVEVGFHSLRHTFVSLQAEMGTPLAVVQAIVGHGSPAMTKHYTHIGESAALEAAKVLDHGITDAEFIEIQTVPNWIREKIEKMTAKNWKNIKDEILGE